MSTKIIITEEEMLKIQEIAEQESEAKTTAERLDLHGKALKFLLDLLLDQYDSNKDYTPSNART